LAAEAQGALEFLDQLLPQARLPRPPAPAARRIAEAWQRPGPARPAAPAAEREGLDAALTFSADEVLRRRDFEQLSAAELARAKRLVARMSATLRSLRPVATRRFAPDPHGPRIDLARTARDSRRTLGD